MVRNMFRKGIGVAVLKNTQDSHYPSKTELRLIDSVENGNSLDPLMSLVFP
jgi:hypothetical protein